MTDTAPQREWIPSRDYLGRRPLVETWPGLRPEIKASWEAIAKASTAARVAATWGEWTDFLALSMSCFRARLRSMARLGLIRWSADDDGSRRVTIELVDPLLLDRIPVGTAARVRRLKLGGGSFEMQTNLWPDSRGAAAAQPLRLAVCDESEAEPVQLQGPEPARVQASEAEPVQLQKSPERGSRPPASFPQSPAGARRPSFDVLDVDVLDETSKEPNGGQTPANESESARDETRRDDFCSTENRDGSDGGGPSPDPIAALTADDFEARREEIIERANSIACRLWRVDQREAIRGDDRSLLVKACFLASAKPCSPYGWTWLDDAVDRACKSKARTTLQRPGAYLHKIFKAVALAGGRDFNRDLAVLESIVHRDLFTAPPRASPPAALAALAALAAKDPPQPASYDAPWVPNTPEKLAEGLAATAAARQAIKAARARQNDDRSPSSPTPNPSKETPCERC